ncbi:hypothetical protein M409DRAFT_54738 [Zasmidium cellare ATCC 36951]|uniref:NAD(P)-binding protein n=1 Tax=Zasmidium cellare ATCC 36951 TaxID=1080233 RepID=A0A6A6CLF3_ZASCE|nr:uncharacterized protein M409DRAFT_54738 [Zasmidium cellare ATCC 36951]KAF2166980.1 hypothetical protein M409DRAFT_54738 [Zasmidium cellare ATCC 36951]
MADTTQERMMSLIMGTKPVDFTRSIDPSTVRGKIAVITGGASGIGRGIAEGLASNGAKVAILDISDEQGQHVASELKAKGHEALFVKTDVASWEAQLEAFKAALKWSGSGLDIVVAAAGIRATDMRDSIVPKKGDEEEEEEEEEEPPKPHMKVLDINFTGVWWTTNLALFYFNKFHASRSESSEFGPQILLISSLAGYGPPPFDADYGAAKHGVRGLWKSIRVPDESMAQYQANLLAPGWTHTGMTDSYVHKLKDRGVRVATVADNVRAAMRLIVDQEVSARAVIVAANPEGVEDGQKGSGVFDVLDDFGTLGAGKAILEKLGEGVFDNYV